MQTTVENTDKHTVKLTIEVPVDEFTKDLDRAYRSISNQVKIPGFRKGKVPKQIIDAQIGRDVVREEFLSSAVPTYFRDAVREEDLAPISDPEIQLEQVEDDKPLIFTATVEVRPRLQLAPEDYQGLRVEKPSTEVTDEEIDEWVDRLRERFAELEPADRPVRSEDFVTIDVKTTLHGEDVAEASRSDYLYFVGSGEFGSEAGRRARLDEAGGHPEGERRAARPVRRARRHRRERPGPGEGREAAQAPRGRRRVREDGLGVRHADAAPRRPPGAPRRDEGARRRRRHPRPSACRP